MKGWVMAAGGALSCSCSSQERRGEQRRQHRRQAGIWAEEGGRAPQGHPALLLEPDAVKAAQQEHTCCRISSVPSLRGPGFPLETDRHTLSCCFPGGLRHPSVTSGVLSATSWFPTSRFPCLPYPDEVSPIYTSSLIIPLLDALLALWKELGGVAKAGPSSCSHGGEWGPG